MCCLLGIIRVLSCFERALERLWFVSQFRGGIRNLDQSIYFFDLVMNATGHVDCSLELLLFYECDRSRAKHISFGEWIFHPSDELQSLVRKSRSSCFTEDLWQVILSVSVPRLMLCFRRLVIETVGATLSTPPAVKLIRLTDPFPRAR